MTRNQLDSFAYLSDYTDDKAAISDRELPNKKNIQVFIVGWVSRYWC